MAVQTIVPGVHLIPMGFVNAVLLEDENGPVLIDTGMPDSAPKILAALEEKGLAPADVQKIIVTHKHIDHTGSLAALKRATGAPAAMHPVDAAQVRIGVAMHPVKTAPGLFSHLMAFMIRRMPADLEAAEVEEEVGEGDRLPLAGGIEVLHTPGHSAGHISLFMPRDGGILITGDAANHVMGLRMPPIFEDSAAGMASLRRLASMEFDKAIFFHGKSLLGSASRRFAEKWGRQAG